MLFYHPIRWYTLPRINNRTHRELIVVDGKVGFIGGAGFGDHWAYDHGKDGKKRRWRDTMFRVEGPAVRDLQAAFAENWLETSGEVLADMEYFRWCEEAGDSSAMVVASSPSTGTLVAQPDDLPDPARLRPEVDPHHHALLPARPLRARGADPRGRGARGGGEGHRARQALRPPDHAALQPPPLRQAAARGREDLRVPARR